MAYAFDNALFQWEEGERRLHELPEPGRTRHERVLVRVTGELRRRLGSSFRVEELAELYGEGVDWALDTAWEAGAEEGVAVVDAAFGRYARDASNYGGGRRREAF